MADSAIEDLAELTAPVDADVLAIVDDPAGSPSTKKITVANVNKIFAVKIKPADETINTDTTLSDDDTMVFTPTINKVYFFKLVVKITTAAAPGIKMAMSVPTGCTIRWGGTGALIYRTTTLAVSADATSVQGIAGAQAEKFYGQFGTIEMGSTSGDISFQWAQNVSDGGSTTVEAGSALLVWEEGK